MMNVQLSLFTVAVRDIINMEKQSDFKKKRQEFSVSIRRADREEKIRRRRNNAIVEEQSSNAEIAISEKRRATIVDQRYQQLILNCISTRYSMQNFQQLALWSQGEDVQRKHEGAIGIRKLLSEANQEAVNSFFSLGLPPYFMAMMHQDQYKQLKLQSAWAMTNVLNGTQQQCQILVNNNIIPLFIDIVKYPEDVIAEQGIWALGNLSADNYQFRNMIIEAGGLKAVIEKFSIDKHPKYVVTSAWSISNICRGQPPPKYEHVKASVPILAQVLKSEKVKDPEVISDCLWTLAYLIEGPKIRMHRLLEANCLPRIVELIDTEYPIVYVPALRIVGSFISGNQQLTEEVLKCGFLGQALRLLSHNKKVIRRQISWILSNITAGTKTQSLLLLKNFQLINKVLLMLNSDEPNEIKIELCWMFANLGRTCIPEDIAKLYEEINIINHLFEIMKAQKIHLTVSALQCLYKILLVGENVSNDLKQNPFKCQILQSGNAEYLQQLQHHENEQIEKNSSLILTTFLFE